MVRLQGNENGCENGSAVVWQLSEASHLAVDAFPLASGRAAPPVSHVVTAVCAKNKKNITVMLPVKLSSYSLIFAHSTSAVDFWEVNFGVIIQLCSCRPVSFAGMSEETHLEEIHLLLQLYLLHYIPTNGLQPESCIRHNYTVIILLCCAVLVVSSYRVLLKQYLGSYYRCNSL